MAATPSVKVTKSFLFRGSAHLWTNRYHFNGGTPADIAHWNTLFDAITAAEKAIFPSTVTIVTATGYAAGSDVPVAVKTYSLAGTGSWASSVATPGDVAGLVRYATAVRTAKNHPVYLFNYYHGVAYATGTPDIISVGQKASMATYAGTWVSPGFSDGTTSYNRAGPNGANATGVVVENDLTHRDFPR